MTLSTDQIIGVFLALAVPGISGFVWLIRLEGRVNYNEKMITNNHEGLNELRVKHESLDSKIVEKLTKVEVALAEIRGILKNRQQDEDK